MIVDFLIGLAGFFLFEAIAKPVGVTLLQRKARAILPELFEMLERVVPEHIAKGTLNLRSLIDEAIGEIDPDLPEGDKNRAIELYLEEYNPAIAAQNIASYQAGANFLGALRAGNIAQKPTQVSQRDCTDEVE